MSLHMINWFSYEGILGKFGRYRKSAIIFGEMANNPNHLASNRNCDIYILYNVSKIFSER